jgi:hypothetical protein
VDFFTGVMTLRTKLLPRIVNKPEAEQRTGLLRQVVFYRRLADGDGDAGVRAGAHLVAELCGCLAEADSAGKSEILAGLQDAHTSLMAAKGA